MFTQNIECMCYQLTTYSFNNHVVFYVMDLYLRGNSTTGSVPCDKDETDAKKNYRKTGDHAFDGNWFYPITHFYYNLF